MNPPSICKRCRAHVQWEDLFSVAWIATPARERGHRIQVSTVICRDCVSAFVAWSAGEIAPREADRKTG
jgi:hypothetical protein